MKEQRYPELSALKGLMREKNLTYREMAARLPMALNTLNDKLNGYSLLNSEEIQSIIFELGIPTDLIPKYFFPKGVTE